MILNAKIDSAEIVIEDHGNLTFFIGVTTEKGWSTSIGGYFLEEVVDEREGRKTREYASEMIRKTMEAVGVNSWSDLVGKYVRVDDNDRWNSPVHRMGNILSDNWVDFNKIIYKYKENT